MGKKNKNEILSLVLLLGAVSLQEGLLVLWWAWVPVDKQPGPGPKAKSRVAKIHVSRFSFLQMCFVICVVLTK